VGPEALLKKYGAILNKGSAKFSEEQLLVWKEGEELYIKNVQPILAELKS
jgi:hypothetical protein